MLPYRLSREQLKRIKKLDLNELNQFLQDFYAEAYIVGLREGEKEFEDAVILTEDEVKERTNEEVFIKLTKGKSGCA